MTEKEYRYAERVLYSYRSNKEHAERLNEELRMLRRAGEVHGQQYGQTTAGLKADPVARYVDEVMSLESRLKRVTRRVRAVERMREDLEKGRVITVTKPRNLLLILDGYYIPGATVNEFLTVFCWSRSIFYVRRRELVMVTGEYLRG